MTRKSTIRIAVAAALMFAVMPAVSEAAPPTPVNVSPANGSTFYAQPQLGGSIAAEVEFRFDCPKYVAHNIKYAEYRVAVAMSPQEGPEGFPAPENELYNELYVYPDNEEGTKCLGKEIHPRMFSKPGTYYWQPYANDRTGLFPDGRNRSAEVWTFTVKPRPVRPSDPVDPPDNDPELPGPDVPANLKNMGQAEARYLTLQSIRRYQPRAYAIRGVRCSRRTSSSFSCVANWKHGRIKVRSKTRVWNYVDARGVARSDWLIRIVRTKRIR